MSIDDGPYEPLAADQICDKKCNCTSENATSTSESEKLFYIDCTMQKFTHLLSEWPKEIGENHSGEAY